MSKFDRTEPVAGSSVLSAPVRTNFQAIEEKILGASAKAQATPDLTVKVEAFVYFGSDGVTRRSFAGGNSPALVAPAANPRIALLQIDDAGSLAWKFGTEAATPSAPDPDIGKVSICEVFQRVGMTQTKDVDDATQGFIQRQASKIRAVIGDGSFRSVQAFTASGTWTKPAGLRRIEVWVLGGGGGGGGAAATAAGEGAEAGGGGGGGGAWEVIEAAALGTTETATVGGGGAGGAAGANAGAAGGTSSLGAHLSATGGDGGAGAIATTGRVAADGGSPGIGSGGTVNTSGGDGALGLVSGGLAIIKTFGGSGAPPFGGGGQRTPGENSPGIVGNSPGGGGSGAINAVSQAARAGGAGAGGLVVIKEYF